MARSPSLQSLDHWILPQGWRWAGHSDATSPASSSDSSGSCPCDAARAPSQPAASGAADAGRTAPPRGRARPGAGSGRQRQRHSASEREKQRMRTLARALHELRGFLPPSAAPAGRSLSKIETLRLATRYIGHLSALLGLGPEPLRRRPPGDPAPPRGWPERLGSGVLDLGLQGTPPSCPRMQSLPHVSLWTLPSPQPGDRQASPWTPPPAAPELTALHQGIPVSPESYLLPETPPQLSRSACQRLQPQTQWGYWNHSAEMLPSSEVQGPVPTLQLNDESPLQSSGLQLSGCPEFWQEDLEGGHLGIF